MAGGGSRALLNMIHLNERLLVRYLERFGGSRSIGGSRGGIGWRWARVIPSRTGSPCFLGVLDRYGTMAQAENPQGDPSRIIILSDRGPLGGDLSAYLSGRFQVVRVTSQAGAESALASPTAALLVVSDRPRRIKPQIMPLLRQAVTVGSRVLLVGFVQPDLEEDLRDKVVQLPQFPGPEELFEALGGIPPARMKGEA